MAGYYLAELERTLECGMCITVFLNCAIVSISPDYEIDFIHGVCVCMRACVCVCVGVCVYMCVRVCVHLCYDANFVIMCFIHICTWVSVGRITMTALLEIIGM